MLFDRRAIIGLVLLSSKAQGNHLSLSEFQGIWHSDLDSHPYEDALASYDNEQSFVVQEIQSMGEINVSEVSNYSVGTMVCNSEQGLSGYDRIKTLNAILSLDEEPTASDIIVNRNDNTCFLTSMTPNEIESVNLPHVTVTPLTSYMKIRSETVEYMEGKHNDSEEFKGIHVSICHGNSASQIDVNDLANQMLTRIHSERDEMGRSLSLTKKFHWTRDDVDHFSNSNGRKLSFTNRARINRWRQVADEGINAEHQCRDMFDDATIKPIGTHSFDVDLGYGDSWNDASASSASCTLSLLAALSAQPEVCSVGHTTQPKPVNSVAQWITQSGGKPESRPFWDAGLTGKDQVVTVSDSGLDLDNCYFWDSTSEALPRTKIGEVDLNQRKVVQYFAYGDDSDVIDGHGTHVAGSVAGHKSSDGTTSAESTGFADGAAKDSKIAFFDIGFGSTCCTVPGASTLFSPGYDNANSRIHSGSWGAPWDGAPYSYLARDFDDNIYNKFDDMLVVMAAGNEGTGNKASSIINPGTAKNVLTVGATRNSSRQYLQLASFSSRGPTSDGRLKPDILAPGYSLLSASAIPNQTGECDPAKRPVRGAVEGVSYKAGTSMATPIVSGSSAIIRQYLSEGWYGDGSKGSSTNMNNPSAALMKAIIINGGQEITDSVMYDNNQGFGLLDLSKTLPLENVNSFKTKYYERVEMNNEGEDFIKLFTIEDSCNQVDTDVLSATLVWTDPPGVQDCKECLVNDLDLTIKFNDVTHYPNGLEGKDSVNNAERIRLTNLQVGDSVEVSVSSGNLATAKQEFALVVTGCIEEETVVETSSPSQTPTAAHSLEPSLSPTEAHSSYPSASPTEEHSSKPSLSSTEAHSSKPSASPTKEHSSKPSLSPTEAHSSKPSLSPTEAHSSKPSASPTEEHSSKPSLSPTEAHSPYPSASPTKEHSSKPSLSPTEAHSSKPSASPTKEHSSEPSSSPTEAHSSKPSLSPTEAYSSKPSISPTAKDSQPPSRPPSDNVYENVLNYLKDNYSSSLTDTEKDEVIAEVIRLLALYEDSLSSDDTARTLILQNDDEAFRRTFMNLISLARLKNFM